MKRRNLFFGWKGRPAEEARRREQNGSRENRMRLAAFGDIQTVYDVFHTSEEGLTEEQAECSRDEFGKNQVTPGEKGTAVEENRRRVYQPVYGCAAGAGRRFSRKQILCWRLREKKIR